MHANVGDQIVVDSVDLGGQTRRGEILEVRNESGDEHYLVRWDDNGHETLFYPGSTAHVVHPRKAKK